MSTFRERMREAQRQCDRLIGHRNARLRFDMRLADTIDPGGNGGDETWTVWIEADGIVLASATGCNGGIACDAMLQKIKEKKP